MPNLTPYLLFDGNCAEAMTFYQRCLGGDLALTKAGDSPMRDQFPPELHERIINARLTNGDLQITASDWFHPTRRPRPGNTVCVYISNAPTSTSSATSTASPKKPTPRCSTL